MNKIAYKVVYFKHDYRRYESAIISDDSYKLIYAIGVKTVPKDGRIFVFDSYDNAVNFIAKMLLPENFTILKGIAENVGYPHKIANPAFGTLTKNILDQFWNAKQKKNKPIGQLIPTPQGTLSCFAFIPINEC